MTEALKIEREYLPSQLQLIKSTVAFTFLRGGVGSGKTIGGALKALKTCAEYPGIHGIITAPSWFTLNSATIPIYQDFFGKFIRPGSFNRTLGRLETENDCVLFFATTKNPWLLEGPSIGFFHMDEGPKSKALAFKNLQARLRQKLKTVSPSTGEEIEYYPPLQGWLTGTPQGFSWSYLEFDEEKRDDYLSIEAATEDNTLAPPEYIRRLKESYTDEQFALQQLYGKYVEIGGQCPFSMKALNEMYMEAKNRQTVEKEILGEEAEDKELGFIAIYSKRQIAKRYVIGADAATGLGQDDSAFVVALVSPAGIEEVCSGRGKMSEAEFADILAKKSEEYNKAMIVVENAPVGKATLQKLQELNSNIYKDKDKLGWPTVSTTKPMMVADLADAVKDRSLIIRNLDIVEQLMSYIRDEKGKYHGTGDAHDDYVSALMLLIQGMKAIPVSVPISITYPKTWKGG